MPHRFEVISLHQETRAEHRLRKLRNLGFVAIRNLYLLNVTTISPSFPPLHLQTIASSLSNPVSEKIFIDKPFIPQDFTWAVEISFLPGVTDNVGNTVKEIIKDLYWKDSLTVNEDFSSHSSLLMLLDAPISLDEVKKISMFYANPLIHAIRIKNKEEYENGMGIHIPKVTLNSYYQTIEVCLNVSDEELKEIGKYGILEQSSERTEKLRRGGLALDVEQLRAIREYFNSLNRNPTDIELESLAQTWSEHCKHTIFAAQIDDVEEGIFKRYIKGATETIRKAKGKNDICVSVFHDNAGGIIFDDDFVVTDKVETHNTPSALDPFGGAITGILGVNRDSIGFGKGAKPILNRYGFCLGYPNDSKPLYRDSNCKYPFLSPQRIMEGVIEGVNVGGNCSGIPTPQGFLFFDERYKGKPLVFVGTVGLIPRNKKTINKQAQSGDYIVMAGGRVGQDGIHGATFSSEPLFEESPASAVQIGDPITQKKLSDAIIKEARDLNLFSSITDNGAGGLSCSVAEMARECNGCYVELEKIPTKYPNLPPWKIWLSESQERMTFAVPKGQWGCFLDLMKRRGVEATVIGEFTKSGKCIVTYHGETVMDISLEFLHDGLPTKKFQSKKPPQIENANIQSQKIPASNITSFLSHPNGSGFEFVSQQYDHTVQGTSIIGPLQGKGRVNGCVSVIRPLFNSWKGVAVSQALFPNQTESHPYQTAGITITQAIINLVSVGTPLEHIALLDNFCWCDSNNPERLWQLKETARGCYDYAVGFGTPFISGKDSMFNDIHGFDELGNEIHISALPTLLISSIGVVKDVRKCVTMDFKIPGDIIYVITGSLKEERLTDIAETLAVCNAIEEAIEKELISACYAITEGGIGVGLAKMSIAGSLGVETQINENILSLGAASGFIITVTPTNSNILENLMKRYDVSSLKIGSVVSSRKFVIKDNNNKMGVETTVDELEHTYKNAFRNYH